MTRDNVPMPGVIMLYNTTKEKGQEAVADEKGMIQFDVKTSELYYVHHVIYNRNILPITEIYYRFRAAPWSTILTSWISARAPFCGT